MMSVGGLAAGMAHEINNPLGGILQGQQNIRRRLDGSLSKNNEVATQLGLKMDSLHAYLEQRQILHFLDQIADAGKRASDIVENMLQFSRKGDVKRQPTNIATLIDKVLELAAVDYDLKKQYDFRRITIQRDFDPELSEISCIASEIQQVLLNILRNSAQALQGRIQQGETAHITVRTRRQDDMASIEVTDNGEGMDAEARRRVFEPFYTTKPPGLGTGLGMSVSYFIVVDTHGGTMDVTSTPGQGTTVTVTLPIQVVGA
jgi:signal transduction histidine kinase